MIYCNQTITLITRAVRKTAPSTVLFCANKTTKIAVKSKSKISTILDRVTFSCLQIAVMMVNKYSKFHSNILKGKVNNWILPRFNVHVFSKSKKGHNSDKTFTDL